MKYRHNHLKHHTVRYPAKSNTTKAQDYGCFVRPELSVYFVLPDCMLDIACLLDITPRAAQLMQLHRDLPQFLQVKGLYNRQMRVEHVMTI